MGDAWWRFDWAPTASEWQALWALVGVLATVALLVIAWRQLTGLTESNRTLAKSNDLLAASNKALSRPVIVVEFHLQTKPARNYDKDIGRGFVFIRVKNVGPSVARDITLKVTPPFESADQAIHEASRDFVRKSFSGNNPIRMLTPGQEIKYLLDSSAEAVGNDSLPSSYEVTATYTDIESIDEIREMFVLSTAAWAFSIAEDDPLARISKDIQFVSEKLTAITTKMGEG
jgi:hypothetical protein